MKCYRDSKAPVFSLLPCSGRIVSSEMLSPWLFPIFGRPVLALCNIAVLALPYTPFCETMPSVFFKIKCFMYCSISLLGKLTWLLNCTIIFIRIVTNFIKALVTKLHRYWVVCPSSLLPMDLGGLVCGFAECENVSETVIYCVTAEMPVLKKNGWRLDVNQCDLTVFFPRWVAGVLSGSRLHWQGRWGYGGHSKLKEQCEQRQVLCEDGTPEVFILHALKILTFPQRVKYVIKHSAVVERKRDFESGGNSGCRGAEPQLAGLGRSEACYSWEAVGWRNQKTADAGSTPSPSLSVQLRLTQTHQPLTWWRRKSDSHWFTSCPHLFFLTLCGLSTKGSIPEAPT